jgi:hypothetical protein
MLSAFRYNAVFYWKTITKQREKKDGEIGKIKDKKGEKMVYKTGRTEEKVIPPTISVPSPHLWPAPSSPGCVLHSGRRPGGEGADHCRPPHDAQSPQASPGLPHPSPPFPERLTQALWRRRGVK